MVDHWGDFPNSLNLGGRFVSLILQNVNKGSLMVDVNLELVPNQVTTIIGDNGSGKTSVLKTLSGLLVPDSGTIRYFDQHEAKFTGGQPLQQFFRFRKWLSYVNRNVLYLETGDFFYDGASVLQNLRYFLNHQGVRIEDKMEKIVQLQEQFRIKEPLDTPIGKLSRGTKQKYVLIYALTSGKKILLLDEPTLGFDDQSVEMFCELFQTVRQTVVLSTHERRAVEAVSDAVYTAQAGRLQKER